MPSFSFSFLLLYKKEKLFPKALRGAGGYGGCIPLKEAFKVFLADQQWPAVSFFLRGLLSITKMNEMAKIMQLIHNFVVLLVQKGNVNRYIISKMCKTQNNKEKHYRASEASQLR